MKTKTINVENIELSKVVSEFENETIYEFEKKDYVIDKKDTQKKVYYVSNSFPSYIEYDGLKNIMFHIDGKHDIVIDGKGSTFTAKGKQIYIVINNSTNITIKNCNFDYYRPTVTEFTVLEKGNNYVDVKFNETTPCYVENNELKFGGLDEDYVGDQKYCWTQECDPKTGITFRKVVNTFFNFNFLKGMTKAEQLNNGIIRLTYSSLPKYVVGCVYEFRNILRDQAGFFFTNSKNITMENCNIHFMHSLGTVCQTIENFTLDNCKYEPSNGRHTTGFADLVHLIGCKGDIKVTNCTFDGAHDDVLNAHGVHQKICKYLSKNEIIVQFSHPEAYGYKYYDNEDKINFVDKNTLLPYFSANIVETKQIDLFKTYIKLDKNIPLSRLLHPQTVVENISKIKANLLFENNIIKNIPTRGILITIGGKVVVKNNHFIKTQMASILISDDAKSWFESGQVNDVIIENNYFEESKVVPILIKPENLIHKGAVHRNITIQNNKCKFITQNFVKAKSTDNIIISNNVDDKGNLIDKSKISLKHCTNVKIN